MIGTAPRSRCHGDPSLLHLAVHLFVFDRRGRLFLQRRSRSKRIQPGRWDASVGGHVDSGEAPLDAAIREAGEELGIFGFELTFLHQYVWRTDIESELVHTYRCHHEGPFQLHPEEIEEGRFFGRDEVLSRVGDGTLTPNLEHELPLLGIRRAGS